MDEKTSNIIEQASSMLSVLQAEIERLRAENAMLRLANALYTFKVTKRRGRPSTPIVDGPPKEKKPPGPSPEFSEESLALLEEIIPKIRKLHGYHTWLRNDAIRKDSELAALDYFLSNVMEARGLRKGKARVKAMSVQKLLNTRRKTLRN